MASASEIARLVAARATARATAAARAAASSTVKLGAIGGALTLAGVVIASLYGTGSGPDPYKSDSATFPNDLDMNDNYIQFIAKSSAGALAQTVNGATIRLPLPSGLSTDYNPLYNSTDLGAPGTVIKPFDRNMYGITDIPAGAAVGGALAGAGLVATKALLAAKGINIDEAGGMGAAGLKVGLGLAANPNKILLFTGVDFRDHSFSWKLTPRNRTESNTIRKIIELFTYYSHPDFETGGLYFKYPEYFEISFKRDQYLFKLRPSVCGDIRVDYQPQQYASYVRNADGSGDPAPTEVTLSMQFKEVEVITKSFIVKNRSS